MTDKDYIKACSVDVTGNSLVIKEGLKMYKCVTETTEKASKEAHNRVTVMRLQVFTQNLAYVLSKN